MGELKDKLAGTANDLAGKVKEGIGAATGNRELEAKGERQQLKGKAQKLTGDVKGAFGDKV